MDLALRKMSPHLSPADRMSLADQKMSRRNMYGHQMSRSQLAKRKMSMLDKRPSFDDDQGSQYYKHTDGLGNYVYGYSYGTQEKFEEGSPETGVKGHYSSSTPTASTSASTTSPTRRASAFSTKTTASSERSSQNQ